MKKILILLGLLIGFGGYSQNPDYHRFGARTKFIQPDTLSTAQRTALTPKLGTLIYHKDTGISQWEQWNGSSWEELSGTDENAIHDNTAGEINAITEKVTPVGADVLLMEDSEDGFEKKSVEISNLPFLTSVGTLQQVTDEGNSTNNNIQVVREGTSQVSSSNASNENITAILQANATKASLRLGTIMGHFTEISSEDATDDRVIKTPDSDGTIATEEWVTAQNYGSYEGFTETGSIAGEDLVNMIGPLDGSYNPIGPLVAVVQNDSTVVIAAKELSISGIDFNTNVSFYENGEVYFQKYDNTSTITGTPNKLAAFDVAGKIIPIDIPSGSGDMLKSTYDPNSVEGDAFDMDNMVEGTDTKILTAAERTILTNTSNTNSGDVTLAGTPDYLTISGQVITRNQIDLTADVTGDLPLSNIAQQIPYSVLGRTGSGTGDVASIDAGFNTILSRNGSGNVAFNSVSAINTMLGTAILSGNQTFTGINNFTNTGNSFTTSADPYDSGWNGDNTVPRKDDVYDEMEKKISSDGAGRTNAETVSNQYAQSRADYATDGAPSTGTWVFIKDPLNGEELAAGSTTIDFVDADGYATPYIFLDNTTDDETSFTLTDMRELDVVEIYLNQATEPSFTPTVDIVPDTLDWTADSLASTDVTLTVWRDGLGNYQGVYTKRP